MYGHVCETGGTREVLPPRSLKHFTFKVCLNLKIDLRSGISLTLSANSSALHPRSQLLSTLIWLLVLSMPPSIALALHFSLHSHTSHLPSPLFLLLLLLGSPSEIQEFSLSFSSFPPFGGCLITNFSISPSLSFEQWAKNPHASQIGCRVAPFWIHWACLTTAECPCLGLYAREMPGFLSPLLLLLLPFTYSSAAPNHFAKRLIGMQWEESPPPSCPPDQLGLCICPQL